jgi:hypothetical protein
MDKHLILELVGYAASILIGVSMMMSSIVRLRIINLLGAATFATYGMLIGAYPVLVLNSFLTVVNIVFLARMLRTKEYFQLLPLKPDSVYLPYFLDFYRRDITRILPDFVYRPSASQLTLFILRDCSPAGVFIAERRPDGVLRVVLDFVIPHYRDLKIGRFLFVEQAEFFRQQGIKEIVISPRTKEFGSYLVKVGFEPAGRPTGALHIRYAGEAE